MDPRLNGIVLVFVSMLASVAVVAAILCTYALTRSEREPFGVRRSLVLVAITAFATSAFWLLAAMVMRATGVTAPTGVISEGSYSFLRIGTGITYLVGVIVCIFQLRLAIPRLLRWGVSAALVSPFAVVWYSGRTPGQLLDALSGFHLVSWTSPSAVGVPSIVAFGYFFICVVAPIQFFSEYWQFDSAAARRRNDRLSASSTSKVIGAVSAGLAALISLLLAGANFTSLGIFSGLFAAGLTLALSEFLNNVIAGFILTWDDSLSLGNVIRLPDGFTGRIKEFSLRYTVLENNDGIEVLAPNKVLLAGPIMNYSRHDPYVRLAVRVPVGLNEDFERALVTMVRAARSVPRVDKRSNFEPRGFLIEHNPAATILEVRFWISDPQIGLPNVQSDVARSVAKALAKEGIRLPSPVQIVEISRANRPLDLKIERPRAPRRRRKSVTDGVPAAP